MTNEGEGGVYYINIQYRQGGGGVAAANIVYMRVVTRHLTLYIYIRMDVQDFVRALIYIYIYMYTNIRVVYNNMNARTYTLTHTHTHMALWQV